MGSVVLDAMVFSNIKDENFQFWGFSLPFFSNDEDSSKWRGLQALGLHESI